jgi:hypothetical protein
MMDVRLFAISFDEEDRVIPHFERKNILGKRVFHLSYRVRATKFCLVINGFFHVLIVNRATLYEISSPRGAARVYVCNMFYMM